MTGASSPQTLATGVWYHVAVQRRGDDLEILFEGNRIQQLVNHFAGNAIFNQTDQPVTIGRTYDASVVTRIRAMNGWIDAPRVHVGKTLYPAGATYTVPTAPPAPGDQGDRDLVLLHHFDGSDFFASDWFQTTDDGIRDTRIAFIDGARYLDAAPKFGVTHGDTGDNDGFTFTPSPFYWAIGDSDFTIDVWFRPRENEAGQGGGGIAFFNQWIEAGDNRAWRLSFDNATDRLEFVWTTLGTAADERTAFVSGVTYDTLFPINTWTHVAVERQGSNLYIYVNGVLQTLDGASASIGTDVIFDPEDSASFRIGIQDVTGFNGTSLAYWDEIRFTKRAAYGGASFTPETSAYQAPVFPNV